MAWASLGQLYSLDLSGNGLVGPLPAAWARQRGLVRLALGRNALSGGLPREWGRLRSLLQLDLAGNALSGGLPPEWGDLAQVSAVDLSANRLEGALPPAWGRMATLQVLALQGNQLSGVSGMKRAARGQGTEGGWGSWERRQEGEGMVTRDVILSISSPAKTWTARSAFSRRRRCLHGGLSWPTVPSASAWATTRACVAQCRSRWRRR